MKSDAQPIPLAAVVVFPRWLPTLAFVIGTLGTLGIVGMLGTVAVGWQEPPQGERLAALLVTGGATLLAFLFGWALPRARIHPHHLFVHLQRPAPRPGSRARGLLVLVAIGGIAVGVAGTGFGWGSRQFGLTIVNAALLVTMVGFSGAVRQHQRRQAVALFALYAEAVLDPDATRAIDAARFADPAFDAAVRDYLRVNALVAEQVRSQS